jgi:RNA polymerase sigma-70 factor (ECF subfamily)
MADTDEDLLVALRGGELRAFDELYARYERRLFGYVLRLVGDRDLAEDLFQDVLLTVVRDATFDPARGRFSAWLFTVARNRCREQRRRAETRERGDARVPATALPDPEGVLARVRSVRAAMAGLPAEQQELLVLKQVGELSYREIATMQGVKEGTIKSRLHAAMSAFRRALEEIGEGR